MQVNFHVLKNIGLDSMNCEWKILKEWISSLPLLPFSSIPAKGTLESQTADRRGTAI